MKNKALVLFVVLSLLGYTQAAQAQTLFDRALTQAQESELIDVQQLKDLIKNNLFNCKVVKKYYSLAQVRGNQNEWVPESAKKKIFVERIGDEELGVTELVLWKTISQIEKNYEGQAINISGGMAVLDNGRNQFRTFVEIEASNRLYREELRYGLGKKVNGVSPLWIHNVQKVNRYRITYEPVSEFVFRCVPVAT